MDFFFNANVFPKVYLDTKKAAFSVNTKITGFFCVGLVPDGCSRLLKRVRIALFVLLPTLSWFYMFQNSYFHLTLSAATDLNTFWSRTILPLSKLLPLSLSNRLSL